MNILYLYLNDNYFFFILVVVGKVVGNLNIEYFVCMNFVVVGCVFYFLLVIRKSWENMNLFCMEESLWLMDIILIFFMVVCMK